MLNLRTVARKAPALALAAALLTSALGAPSFAQGYDPRDHRNGGPPVARVQVVLHHVKILDDRDWGDGEFYFWSNLICYQTSTPCLKAASPIALAGYEKKFSAGTGESHAFNQVLPDAGLIYEDYDATPEGGYPLRQGHNYHLLFGMEERDSLSDYEQMGRVRLVLTPENGWGLGTHTIRSSRNDDGVGDGDYTLTFEIRRVVAPDLRPVNINVTDLPGNAKKRVCIPIQNLELGQAGPFDVMLRIDDQAPFDARTTVPGLTSGNATEACIETELPTAGQHKLTAIVDPVNTLLEYNEANNAYDLPYTAPAQQQAPATPKPGSATTLPAAGAAQADLVVSTINVNGQAPDGKADCKDGKNRVEVVVKNVGTARVGDFRVRLVVDGDNGTAREEPQADGLEAGQEHTFQFDGVRLKKGERTLLVIADPNKAITEAKDDNNELKVSARCIADD